MTPWTAVLKGNPKEPEKVHYWGEELVAKHILSKDSGLKMEDTARTKNLEGCGTMRK